MTRFFTTSSFRNDLSDLLKVRKNVYAGIEKEIYNEFIGCSVERIRNNREKMNLDCL